MSLCFNKPGILKAVQSGHTWNNGIMCHVVYWVGNILGIMGYIEMTISGWSDINDNQDEKIDDDIHNSMKFMMTLEITTMTLRMMIMMTMSSLTMTQKIMMRMPMRLKKVGSSGELADDDDIIYDDNDNDDYDENDDDNDDEIEETGE